MRNEQVITGKELANVLRKVICGYLPITACGTSWDDTYAGDVVFAVGDYTITIFNDCDDIDYIDSACHTDGRSGDFDYWFDRDEEPVRWLLSRSECDALEALLKKAKVA